MRESCVVASLVTLPPRPLAAALQIGLALLLFVFPTAAEAHKLNLFAAAQGTAIAGQAYFPGMIPAQGATVTASAPDGSKLGQTQTDAQGNFHLEARWRCDYRLVADAGEGHLAEFIVSAAELPGSLPPFLHHPGETPASFRPGETPPTTAAPVAPPAAPPAAAGKADQLESLEAQIVLLRRDLNAFEHETRWRDILGALGYLCGITGLAYYFLGVRRRRAAAAGDDSRPGASP